MSKIKTCWVKNNKSLAKRDACLKVQQFQDVGVHFCNKLTWTDYIEN